MEEDNRNIRDPRDLQSQSGKRKPGRPRRVQLAQNQERNEAANQQVITVEPGDGQESNDQIVIPGTVFGRAYLRDALERKDLQLADKLYREAKETLDELKKNRNKWSSNSANTDLSDPVREIYHKLCNQTAYSLAILKPLCDEALRVRDFLMGTLDQASDVSLSASTITNPSSYVSTPLGGYDYNLSSLSTLPATDSGSNYTSTLSTYPNPSEIAQPMKAISEKNLFDIGEPKRSSYRLKSVHLQKTLAVNPTQSRLRKTELTTQFESRLTTGTNPTYITTQHEGGDINFSGSGEKSDNRAKASSRKNPPMQNDMSQRGATWSSTNQASNQTTPRMNTAANKDHNTFQHHFDSTPTASTPQPAQQHSGNSDRGGQHNNQNIQGQNIQDQFTQFSSHQGTEQHGYQMAQNVSGEQFTDSRGLSQQFSASGQGNVSFTQPQITQQTGYNSAQTNRPTTNESDQLLRNLLQVGRNEIYDTTPQQQGGHSNVASQLDFSLSNDFLYPANSQSTISSQNMGSRPQKRHNRTSTNNIPPPPSNNNSNYQDTPFDNYRMETEVQDRRGDSTYHQAPAGSRSRNDTRDIVITSRHQGSGQHFTPQPAQPQITQHGQQQFNDETTLISRGEQDRIAEIEMNRGEMSDINAFLPDPYLNFDFLQSGAHNPSVNTTNTQPSFYTTSASSSYQPAPQHSGNSDRGGQHNNQNIQGQNIQDQFTQFASHQGTEQHGYQMAQDISGGQFTAYQAQNLIPLDQQARVTSTPYSFDNTVSNIHQTGDQLDGILYNTALDQDFIDESTLKENYTTDPFVGVRTSYGSNLQPYIQPLGENQSSYASGTDYQVLQSGTSQITQNDLFYDTNVSSLLQDTIQDDIYDDEFLSTLLDGEKGEVQTSSVTKTNSAEDEEAVRRVRADLEAVWSNMYRSTTSLSPQSSTFHNNNWASRISEQTPVSSRQGSRQGSRSSSPGRRSRSPSPIYNITQTDDDRDREKNTRSKR